MSSVRRIYVEKKPAYAVAAKDLFENIRDYLGIRTVTCLLYTSDAADDS